MRKMIRRRKWMSYMEAEQLLRVSMEDLTHLVHDSHIRKQPWYRRPYSLSLLRRDDVERCAATRTREGA
jgi:hypothetical protein